MRKLCLSALVFTIALSTGYAQGDGYDSSPVEEGEILEGEDLPNVPEPDECCPGENLIGNGDFNNSLPGFFSSPSFSSDYGLQTSWGGMFPNGSYGHFMPDNSSWIHNKVCVDWQIHDQDYCGNQFDGGYLLVNGLTNGYGLKTVFQFDISLEQGVYNLCSDFKYLRDKCFDYVGPDLILKVTGSTTTQKVFNVNTTAGDPCEWQTEVMNFAVNSNQTVTISLIQNANRYTDGNDFAMDNFTLKRIENVNGSNVAFSTSTDPDFTGKYDITCTLQNPLEDPCTYSWSWCKWDGSRCVGSPSGSQTSSSSIKINKVPANTTVKIVCTVQCPCGLATSHYAIVVTGPGSGRISIPSIELKPDELSGLETISNTNLSGSGNHNGNLKEPGELTFDIFPNPNNGEFTIHSPGTSLENAEVEIYAADGRKVFYSEVKITNGNDIPLQLQELPAGIYKVILTNSKTRQQNSLIIK